MTDDENIRYAIGVTVSANRQLRVALEKLIVAVEWELPPISDGIDVENRIQILYKCLAEAKEALR